MRKKVLALLAPLLMLPLVGCEAIGEMTKGKTKETYALHYAEAWLDLKTVVDMAQTPRIDQKVYTRQLQATETDIRRWMEEYADRPEANSGSYKTLFEILGHYKHAAELWANRKGALLVMQQFEEAEDLMPKAEEYFVKEYETPLAEVVAEANLARIAKFEAERAKQEAAEKEKKEKAGGGHGGGHG